LSSAKEETRKLLDFLENDFGFSGNELRVFFSGHRGYHVHVENERIKALDAYGRNEIVDYVSGLGLSIQGLEDFSKSKVTSKHSLFHDFAWNKRIKRGLQKLISTATLNDLRNIGLKTAKSNIILDNKKSILKRCIDNGFLGSFKGVNIGTWKKLAEYVKDLESAKIDTVVTTDIHRLIRLNGTLHGKTGLKKVEFSIKDLEDFDPFESAVAFKKGAVKVFVSDAPEFRLGGKVLGPLKSETVELPTAAAVLLICKGRAEVRDN
jgi:DNA primase small subunit